MKMYLGKAALALGAGGLMFSNSAGWALPALQLDVLGGTYNTTDETTYSTTTSFDLRALLDPTKISVSGNYYISAAITPQLAKSTPAPNIGSFSINGVTYSSANLVYGTPPIDVPDTSSGNLPSHGIFPTYYAEILFHFTDPKETVGAYNTADGTTAPGVLNYHDFSVDTSGMLPGYDVHFDLYDETIHKLSGKKLTSISYTVDDFAPFSHDAQSGGSNVPDGGSTMALLGGAMATLALVRRKLAS